MRWSALVRTNGVLTPYTSPSAALEPLAALRPAVSEIKLTSTTRRLPILLMESALSAMSPRPVLLVGSRSDVQA